MNNVQDGGAVVADPNEEQELDELLGGGADAGDQDDAEAGDEGDDDLPDGDPENDPGEEGLGSDDLEELLEGAESDDDGTDDLDC